jgi:hypothetical protein
LQAQRHFTPILLALAAGAFLAWYSIPQLIGGAWLFGQENTLDRLGGGVPFAEKPTPELIADAIGAWSHAAPKLNDSQTWDEYGDIMVTAANASDQNLKLRNAQLATAEKAYRAAIERSPSNGRAWTMLTSVRVKLGATPDEISNLLRMSLRTAPRDPPLVITRLDSAFYIWRVMPPDLRAQMAEQVRIAAENDTWHLVRLVHLHFMLEPVRDILASDRDLQWTFDRAYMGVYR